MNVALIDDDKAQMYELSELISNELSLVEAIPHTLKLYSSSDAFFSAFSTEKFDLIILDIYIDHITGIDIAKKIRETDSKVQIVFCSSSNEFASESYEVNALYYLQKPVNETKIDNMFRKYFLNTSEQNRTIRMPDGHFIPLRSILYTEYSNHVITLHLKNNASYRLRSSHVQLESLLCPYEYFISPFKGMLVNLYEVASISNDTLLLHNGQILPMARRRSKEVKDTYNHFFFKRLHKEFT